MPKKLSCLSQKAINNRFLQSGSRISQMYVEAMLKPEPWMGAFRENRIARLMKEKNISRKKAVAIIAKERRAWSKHYDSPLGKAERRIQELERHLEDIKALVLNPAHFDNP